MNAQLPGQSDVVIAGGGLAGLVSSILLARAGMAVTLLEKQEYPFHRVCGEYVSNEVIPFLEALDLFPSELNPSRIERLQITSVGGASFEMPLDLGGFGISRYRLDHWLAQKARAVGVTLLERTTVQNVSFTTDHFEVTTSAGVCQAALMVGSFGKRSRLDKTLERDFLQRRSPYVGVKYHLRADFPRDLIALHNFAGGYCGVSRVEGDTFNMCYLIHRDEVRKHQNLVETERQVLARNPFLRQLFHESERLFEKPEVINEISFERKEIVQQHVLMAGDAAGMITPLCGNGMAIAIRSAKILSETILEHWNQGSVRREALEQAYSRRWRQSFATRLWAGRQIQGLFGGTLASSLAVATGRWVRPVARVLMKQTHGELF